MTDPDAAQKAAEALIAMGWPVVPSEDFEAWVIGDLVWTDAELIALALTKGVQVLSGEPEALSRRPQ